MARERAFVCAIILAAATLTSCASSPPGAPCASDHDCFDGVCRVSAVTGERTCYSNCPADQIDHLCDDGSQCVGYCRGDQGPNPLGAACDSTDECLPGLECFDGTCTRVCDEDHLDICEPGTTCELFPAGWGLCRTP